jgi:hypothetical protein
VIVDLIKLRDAWKKLEAANHSSALRCLEAMEQLSELLEEAIVDLATAPKKRGGR